jgi:hypothetical protein
VQTRPPGAYEAVVGTYRTLSSPHERAHHAVLPVGEVQSKQRRVHASPRGYDPNFVHCPSETTSTQPSTTLIAVCSSMA